jgi:tetratricopeptide (TPR) repeat protein
MLNHPVSRILVALMTLGLAACASRGDDPVAAQSLPPLPKELEANPILPRTNPDVLYYVGAAEIAGLRKEHALAADLYRHASDLSEDPAIAGQAVKVALFVNDEELTLRGIDRWLALQPDNLEPHRFASIIYLRRGDVEKSWEHIAILVENDRSAERWADIGKTLSNVPDRGAARRIYRRLLTDFGFPAAPKLAQQFSDLGVQLGDFQNAEMMAGLVIEANPQDAAAYNWRGRLRTSLGRLPEARTDFEQAVELDPENEEMRQAYAALLADLEDYEGAIEQLNQIADNLVVVFSKGIYADASDQDDLAIEYYRQLQLLEVEDQDEKYYFVGQLAEAMERPPEETLDWYSRVRQGDRLDNARLRSALVLGSNDQLPKARIILARLQNGNAQTAARAFLAEGGLLRDADMKADALEVFDRGLDLLQDNTDLLFARALLAESMDMLDVTEADLRRVLEIRKDDPNALNALGYTLADRTDRLDEAYDLIKRALDQMPNEAAIVDSMGWVCFKLGRHEEAISYLERAIEIQFDSEIAAHLGEVLWAMGREQDAMALWDKALGLEPDSLVLIETRSRFLPE